MRLLFTVDGKAESQGSTRAFMPKGARYPIVTSTNKNLKSWRGKVALVAREAMQKDGFRFIESGPIRIYAAFYFVRPKSRKDKVQKDTRPDLDKHFRALGDALTNVVYRDDAQIAEAHIEKLYGKESKTEVCITAL